jgi:hypothetical protein
MDRSEWDINLAGPPPLAFQVERGQACDDFQVSHNLSFFLDILLPRSESRLTLNQGR